MAPWNQPSPLKHDSAARAVPGRIEELWADPTAHLLRIGADAGFAAEEFGVPTTGPMPERVAYLGRYQGEPWFTVREDAEFPDSIRTATLSTGQLVLAMAATAILNWQDAARHCEWCGAELVLAPGSFSAKCPDCGREVFPRTDPAVIVGLVNDADELYLAHNTLWVDGFVSIPAGFSEAGESAENTVIREVFEESKLVVKDLRYLGSQPWPFPRSLMLGYLGLAEGSPQPDGVEIGWGEWFSRESLERRTRDGEIFLAPPASIARRIIDAWRSGEIGRDTFRSRDAG
jgi:NAD+ diphosphatase